jgi:iron complex transport system ATP-binding protein
MSLFQVDSLSFSYRRVPVIDGLRLTIDEGMVIALLGPNGSGKTTLLKLLLGLLKPARGLIRLRGKDIHDIPRRELARQLAYVPQVHREAFGFHVFDVVLMGRMPHSSFFSRYGAKDEQIVWEALEKLGILHLAKRPYTEISGGERQLTLIARALAQGVRVFVMDEPTNGLDYGNQVRLLERVGRLADEGYTFVFTSHHPEHALAIADRVVMMQSGAIIRDGAPLATVTPDKLAELYGLPP